MKPFGVSLIGRKGAGKPSVLENLIELFKEKGYRVGVLKHLAKEDIEIDEPGKDTFRYRMRGAETVVLAGKRRLAVFSNLEAETPVDKLLLMFAGYDLVFLEGYFAAEIPKIEVYRKDLGAPLGLQIPNVIAVCSNDSTVLEVPHISPGQLSSLAHLIEEKMKGEIYA